MSVENIEGKLQKLRTLVKAGLDHFESNEKVPTNYVSGLIIPELEIVLGKSCAQIEEPRKFVVSIGQSDQYIVHYTSIDCLVSMILNLEREPEGSSLRLYDSLHLNDPEEGNFLVKHLMESDRYSWLGQETAHAYMTSFILPQSNCKENIRENDDLVFWRFYGKEGEGCSLTFPTPTSRLVKVCYGTEKVMKSLQDHIFPILDCLDPLAENLRHPMQESTREELSRAIWKHLAKIRFLFKSEAYKHENECRLVVSELDIEDKDEIYFEDEYQYDLPKQMRHYCRADDLTVRDILTSLCTITIGPCVPDRYSIAFYLRNLLRKAGLLGPLVNDSKILYRNP